MSKKNEQFYRKAIESTRPDVYAIKTPKIKGLNSSVFIVETNDGKLVYKTSSIAMVQKNLRATYLMNCLEIPVANLVPITSNNQCFEVYPYLSDKTLREHILNGMPKDKIQNVFSEMIQYLAFMSGLEKSDLDNMPYKTCGLILNENISKTTNPLFGMAYHATSLLLNAGKKSVMHFDMTPENVLVNDAGKISRVLDIDNMAVCNENFAIASVVTKYQKLGFDSNDLLELYEDKTERKLNRRHISAQTKFSNIGRKMHSLFINENQAFK